MRKNIIYVALAAVAVLSSCGKNNGNNSDSIAKQPKDSVVVAGEDCDITIGDIRFTRSVNGADALVTLQEDGSVEFLAGENKDFFCDPKDKTSNTSAPILLTQIDNTKPFTLTAKVQPEFTATGTYNAGVLYLYEHNTHWQKLCFEQDERGKHRVVTVRTIGTSDDNNHDAISGQDYVYFKLSSDTHIIGSYYSLDGEEWQMVRLYRNNYPEKLYVGISNQCPKDKGSKSVFSELKLSQNAISDFRMGE